MKHLRKVFYLTLLALFTISAGIIINSSVYDWEKLPVKKTQTGEERAILSGQTQTLDMFDIRAITLNPNQSLKEFRIENGFDELVILKEGSAEINVSGEVKTLGEGSIAVASQGDIVKIRNPQAKITIFYTFLFKPKALAGTIKSSLKVAPILKDWNTTEFKANENGGRRDIIKQSTSTLKELEMHTTLLNEGVSSHAAHNHPDEEIILMRFGTAEMSINEKFFKGGPGTIFFLTNMDNHGIRNIGKGKCEYYAFRWLTYQETNK